MLSRQSLKGIWGTLLLPIEAQEAISWEKLQEEIDALIESGVHGIYTNGSAGEFFSQDDAEFARISGMVSAACGKSGLPFQIGASHPFPRQCLERIRKTKHLQPDAYQVILPDWFPVKRAEAIAFLSKVAEAAAPIPLVLYAPPHAKAKLTPQDFGALSAAIPSLIGIKVAGGDAAWYEAMRANQVDVAVFVAGHRLATGLPQGARGSYSNIACLHPTAAVRWYEQMHSDPAAALEVEREIMAFLTRRILPLCDRYVDAAIDKLLAYAGNWASAGLRLRWPYAGVPVAEADEIRSVTRAELTRLFALL